MDILQALINLLNLFLVDTWYIVFAGVWFIGQICKNHPNLDNRFIPWIVLLTASFFGMVVIQWSVGGFLIGFLAGILQIGLYELYKNIKLILKPREDDHIERIDLH